MAALIVALIAITLLPSAPSFSIVQATSEAVFFDVAVPEMAQIRLDGFATYAETATGSLGFGTSDGTARKPLCLTGVLVPASGTRVTYKRFHDGPVSVVLERRDGMPAGNLDLGEAATPEAVKRASWLRLEAVTTKGDDAPKSLCPGDPFLRLPVYGVAEIGSELRPLGRGREPSAGVLLDGTVTIFVRTLEFGGLVPKTRIYPSSISDITLPPGSKVLEDSADGEVRRPWTGFVQADADDALGVKLITEAKRLAILRPGIGLTPEILSFSFFSQLMNDPTLQSVQIIGAFLFSVLYSLGTALSWYDGRHPLPATRNKSEH
ncbi:hypothetical protein [Methylobacterium sp. J-067]|uniref:hypothetical protein n=1 Tax=Methylobacterium sp. J-067 TaxID=2836648 RepID=UPI001FBB39B6|nr:hypothetical protein [Methylobacterium sp. J-067]MCJ2025146.1 hypothetical protein [Methylobacterium sp. J-067]